jgi:hypothetical protein
LSSAAAAAAAGDFDHSDIRCEPFFFFFKKKSFVAYQQSNQSNESIEKGNVTCAETTIVPRDHMLERLEPGTKTSSKVLCGRLLGGWLPDPTR